MKTIRLATFVVACSITSPSAFADPPASKGAVPGKTAGSPAGGPNAQAGGNEKSAAHRDHSRHDGRDPKANENAARASGKKGRDDPGRPESSGDVPGKAKGLDKEPPGRALGHDKEKTRGLGESDAEEDRALRRKASVTTLKKRWGNLLLEPAAMAEQKVHARRVAWLERMHELATGNDRALSRVEELRTKEDARHARRMGELSEKGARARGAAVAPAAQGADPSRGRPEETGRDSKRSAKKEEMKR